MKTPTTARIARAFAIPLIVTLMAPITANASWLRNDEMVLDISWPSNFFAQGFPSDMRQTNGKINVSDFPRPLNLFSLTYKHQISTTDFGFSPAMSLYMQFESGFVASSAIANMNATDYASSNSPVQVIDIDPDSPEYGQRYPLQVAVTAQADQYRPVNLLQVRAVGKPLRENTTYALITTRNFAANSSSAAPSGVLKALLDGNNPWFVNPLMLPSDAARAQNVYAPLRAFMASNGMSSNDIIGATVWTTGNPTRYVDQIVDKVSQWTPPQPTSNWILREETADYCVLQSNWKAPGLQRGLIPYFTDGTIAFNSSGNPITQYQRTTPIIVTIPKQPMPANGFPLLHYHHGTGGWATQVFERGYTNANEQQDYVGSPSQVAAQRGWAAAAMGGHLGADHQAQLQLIDQLLELIPGFTLNHATYNFLNPVAMRDNFAQMVAERTLYSNMLQQLQINAQLCPGASSASGQFHFDTDKQAVMGQSLGSMTASVVAAQDQRYKGLIATGAGTYGLGLALYYSIGETDIGGIIESIYLDVAPGEVVGDLFHPVWAMAELITAPANVALFTARWQQSPAQAASAPHVLVVEGHYDEQVTLPMQRPYLVSLGTDFVNEELDLAPADQLLPDLQVAGYTQLFSPVSANRDGRTVAVVRYPEDGIMTGHHVAFQYPQPQHQYGCFLEDILAGETPVIVRGEILGGDCY